MSNVTLSYEFLDSISRMYIGMLVEVLFGTLSIPSHSTLSVLYIVSLNPIPSYFNTIFDLNL